LAVDFGICTFVCEAQEHADAVVLLSHLSGRLNEFHEENGVMPALATILPKQVIEPHSFHSSIVLVLLYLLGSAIGQAQSDKGIVDEIRTLYPSEWSVPYPTGVAYASDLDHLFLIDRRDSSPLQGSRPTMAIITPYEDLVAMVELPLSIDDVINMTFDDVGQDLLLLVNNSSQLARLSIHENGQLSGTAYFDVAHLGLNDAEGIAVDSDAGDLYILDSGDSQVVRAEIDDGVKVVSKVSLKHLGNHRMRGIAIHPQSHHIFVASPSEDVLYELTVAGQLVHRYSLSALDLVDSRAMSFAPSADLTDDPNTVHLYLVDSNLPDEAIAQGGRRVWIDTLCHSLAEKFRGMILTETCAYFDSDQPGATYGRLLEVELMHASSNDRCILH
jgi:hypothetical protein